MTPNDPKFRVGVRGPRVGMRGAAWVCVGPAWAPRGHAWARVGMRGHLRVTPNLASLSAVDRRLSEELRKCSTIIQRPKI